MFLRTFVLICMLVAVLGYPKPAEDLEIDKIRERRQLNLKFGGDPLNGFDLNFGGIIPILRNPDGSPRFGISGNYNQHFGGPDGNSLPNFNANAEFSNES